MWASRTLGLVLLFVVGLCVSTLLFAEMYEVTSFSFSHDKLTRGDLLAELNGALTIFNQSIATLELQRQKELKEIDEINKTLAQLAGNTQQIQQQNQLSDTELQAKISTIISTALNVNDRQSQILQKHSDEELKAMINEIQEAIHYLQLSTNSSIGEIDNEIKQTSDNKLPPPEQPVVVNQKGNINDKWLQLRESVDWDGIAQFQKDVGRGGAETPLPPVLMEQVLSALTPVIEMEPDHKANFLTRPKSLQYDVNCNPPSGNPLSGFLTGGTIKNRTIIDVFTFGYELDTLEVRLHELNDVVDLFVIGEASCTHKLTRKKLILSSHLFEERFAMFRHKMAVFILDDQVCDAVRHEVNTMWRFEVYSRNRLWERFQESTFYNDYVNKNSLFIHGDCDEVPKGVLMDYLRHCDIEPSKTPIGMAGTFYQNNFGFVVGPAIANGFYFPTVATVENMKYPNKVLRDSSFLHTLPLGEGGYHLNRFGSNYLRVYKHLALAEGGQIPRFDINILKDPNVIQKYVDEGARECCDQPRALHINGGLSWIKTHVPWYVYCNYERFAGILPDYMIAPHTWPEIAAEWCHND